MAAIREAHKFHESTRVIRAWYSPDEKLIETEFRRDGVRWLWFNCERDTWERFKTAESPGRYLRLVLERHVNRRR